MRTLSVSLVVVSVWFSCCVAIGSPAPKCAKVKALGMENGDIPDSRITASNRYRHIHPPYLARPDNENMWNISPVAPAYQTHWVSVDLGKIQTLDRIGVHGRSHRWGSPYCEHGINLTYSYVKTYELWFSNDGHSYTRYDRGRVMDADINTKQSTKLNPKITARYVTLVPRTWYNTIAVLWSLYSRGIDVMYNLPDKQFTASSYLNIEYPPSQARLNNKFKDQDKPGAWMATGLWRERNQRKWLQVDLGKVTTVTGIATQGAPQSPSNINRAAWTKTYMLEAHGKELYKPIVFTAVSMQGNTDGNTIVRFNFHTPFQARYIRVYPLTWEYLPAMRLELYGC